ncbi:MAG: TolC family protein [Planctomycetes bacterium]|nr:TolC family protein [Planctomycetota bacterium]
MSRITSFVLIFAAAFASLTEVATAEETPQPPPERRFEFGATDSMRSEEDLSESEIKEILSRIEAIPGMEAQGETKLSLDDAISRAMAEDGSISFRTSLLSPQSSRQSLRSRDAAFEPLLTGSVRGSFSQSTPSSALDAGQGATVSIRRGINYSLGVSKLWSFGTQTSLSYTVSRGSSNSSFATLNPSYNQSLGVSISQPLLRGIGSDATLSEYRQALNNLESAELSAVDAKMQAVQQVESAYWELYYAQEDLKVNERNLANAQDMVFINIQRFRVGDVARINLTQALASEASAVSQVLSAQNTLAQRTDALLSLIMPEDENLDSWKVKFVLDSKPDIPNVDWTTYDAEEIITDALKTRPDVLQSELSMKNAEIVVTAADNGLLPELNLEGGFNYTGLGKDFPQSGEFTHSSGNRGLLGRQFYEYNVGISVSVPLGNEAKEAAYESALISKRQAELSLRLARTSAISDIRSKIRDLHFQIARIEVTAADARLKESQYNAEVLRWQNGLSTSFQVDEFRKQDLESKRNYQRALIDARLAYVSYQRSLGVLGKDIVVQDAESTSEE